MLRHVSPFRIRQFISSARVHLWTRALSVSQDATGGSNRMRWIVTAIALALFALGGSAWAQAAGTFFTDAKSRCKLWWPAKEPYYDDGKIAATWTILSVK